MGLVAKVLSFTRITRNGAKVSDVKFDSGGGNNATGEHYATPGDDSQPLPDDYMVAVRIDRAGGRVTVGYIDPSSTQKAGKGEKRTYARDSDGAEVVDLWLKADGSAIMANDKGSFELQSGGDCVINGVTIDINGKITSPTEIAAPSIKGGGKELSVHAHGGVTTGTGSTGPNL